MERYRFLTIAQVVKASGLSVDHTAELLRGLEVRGIAGHFGHVRNPGHGKTPRPSTTARTTSRTPARTPA